MAFFAVAGRAGGHQIFPGVLTTFAARDNMIKSQIGPAGAAILAAMIIAQEQVLAIQQYAPGRCFDIATQADNSWQWKNFRNGVNSQRVMFLNNLNRAGQTHDNRAPGIGDC